MTTAHRATWYTARGHEEQGGARVFAPSKMRSKLDAPGMLTMKTRWKTKEEEEMESLTNNNKDDDSEKMTTMRMKLLEKERTHFRKKKMERQIMGSEKEEEEEDQRGNNRLRIEAGTTRSAFQANPDDADDDDSENEGDNSDDGEKNSEDEDESDSDDDAAALMEELERIKAQRALENERKEREREHLEEMEQRDELKMGNPLLRDEMADANDGGAGKPIAGRAETREEIRQRYHTKRFPQEVFEPLHQIIHNLEKRGFVGMYYRSKTHHLSSSSSS